MRKPVVGVMCGGDAATEEAVAWARELGRAIATEGWVLLSGGRSVGAMDATCRAAQQAGGLVVAVLPARDTSDVSDGVDVAIVTGMGSARNNINVLSSDVVIAIGGTSGGTISEIGLAIKASTPVVLLTHDSDAVALFKRAGPGLVHLAESAGEAVDLTRELIHNSGRSRLL